MKKFNHKGFTMVELLIVLAIIAILAAVAIPVYSSQIENAKKRTDEANLRTATGLAAQDILLADPGVSPEGVLQWKDRRYIVFTYEDQLSDNKANSRNMLVYRDGGTIDMEGNWYEGHNPTLPNTKPAFYTTNYSYGGNDLLKNWGTHMNAAYITNAGQGMINGRRIALYPLQQNGGNARFSIVIKRNGTVVESKIEIGKKLTALQ